MTASKLIVHQPIQTENIIIGNNAIFMVNLGLTAASLAAFLVYIFLTNYFVSQRYSLNLMRIDLSRANLNLEIRNAEIENIVSLESLYSFAQKTGMVEAKETESVFASSDNNSGVALTEDNN